MIPTAKHRPKMEARFFQAIWLGKDTSTNENILGISGQIVKARTIRRQTKPDKYNKQMMDIIDSTPMTIPTPTSFVVLPTKHTVSSKQATATAETQTQQAPELPVPKASHHMATPAITDVPMATSPTSHHRRAPLPVPTTAKRDVADDIAEGSSAKQQKTTQQQTAAQRPEATQEPDKTRLRVSAVTVTTKRGDKVQAVSNENQQEVETEKILLEPWVTNSEGLDQEQTTEGMKQEIRSMKAQQVYTEVSYNTLTSEQRNKIIKSRWVLRQKGDIVRARIVAKGYTEEVKDNDDIYASTPVFCVLRLLLTMSLVNNWKVKAGDISTAFLHAKAATDDLFMFPPTELYNLEDQVVWKLNKAIYGLRSSPHAWQKHLAETLQQLGMERLASEPNVFKTTAGNAFILCYVDDLLFLGEPTVVDKLFTDIQQHLLLRPTGDLTVGNTINFLGRNITNKGDYYEVSLSDKYTTDLLHEAGMANSKAAPAPGTKVSNTDLEQPLNTEEHKAYRRAVGKLQWMTYTRPDISYATKELARSLTEPTTADQQKLKHLQEVHQRNTALQVLHPTKGQNIGHHSRCRCLRRQRLGRMCNNAEVNFGLCRQVHGRSDSLRQPHTINNSTQQRRSRTLRHQHRSNRSTTHSKLLDGSTQQEESQHQDLHGLFKWEKHGNTDWIIKESKTHRVETSLYPTIGAQRRRANPQDQHGGKSGRHLHQVRCNRDALPASQ